jgi:hypothetical protein
MDAEENQIATKQINFNEEFLIICFKIIHSRLDSLANRTIKSGLISCLNKYLGSTAVDEMQKDCGLSYLIEFNKIDIFLPYIISCEMFQHAQALLSLINKPKKYNEHEMEFLQNDLFVDFANIRQFFLELDMGFKRQNVLWTIGIYYQPKNTQTNTLSEKNQTALDIIINSVKEYRILPIKDVTYSNRNIQELLEIIDEYSNDAEIVTAAINKIQQLPIYLNILNVLEKHKNQETLKKDLEKQKELERSEIREHAKDQMLAYAFENTYTTESIE